MCVKFSPENLNSDNYPSHFISICQGFTVVTCFSKPHKHNHYVHTYIIKYLSALV